MEGGMGGPDQSGGAYGAGKAGGDFDPLTFIKRPVTILRICSWVFAIVVFSVASNSYRSHKCYYNEDQNTCGFSIFVGVLGFLACSGFLIADALFDNIPSVKTRKHLVIADLGFSGVWSFFFFVNFCYMADAWGKTEGDEFFLTLVGSKPGAIIAFSFFSVFTFAALTFFAYRKYRAGVSEPFATRNDFDQSGMGGDQGGYTPYPGGAGSDPYQPSPFGGQNNAASSYAGPTY